MAKKTKEKKELNLEEFAKLIQKQLEVLTAEVRELKENKGKETLEKKPGVVEKTDIRVDEPPVQTANQKFPIPQEYREIIDQTLNRHFGIEVKGFTDQPAFMLTIIVPKKYSNMSEDEYQARGADLRSRVISYAEGTNGVKLWADKVFDNFVSEIKAQIIADRI